MGKPNPLEVTEGTKLNPKEFGITPLQARFAVEYIKDFNAAEAIQRAGSPTKNPRQHGSQLKNHPKIKEFIKALISERSESLNINPDYVLTKIVKVIERAENGEKVDNTTILRGCELLARHLGMFIERTEISGRDGEAIKMEKVAQDAADFAGAIARLASRRGTTEGDSETSH